VPRSIREPWEKEDWMRRGIGICKCCRDHSEAGSVPLERVASDQTIEMGLNSCWLNYMQIIS